jgi:hypothetical protein
MSDHTPGPWRWNECGECWLQGGDGCSILHVDPYGNDVPEGADRLLIAAAPDLLDALVTLVRATDGHASSYIERNLAVAAVAKAMGAA